jgi:hypothetical protein
MSKRTNGEDVVLDVPVTYAGEPHEVGETINVLPHDARWLVEGGRAHRPRKAPKTSPSTTSQSEVTDDE